MADRGKMRSVSVLALLCLFTAVLCQTINTQPLISNATIQSSKSTKAPLSQTIQKPVDFVNNVLRTCSVSYVKSIARLCRESDLMCKYTGCGERVDSDRRDYPCYCDHRCIAYGDCCYDFHDSCKEEVGRSKVISYLEGVSVRCLDVSYVSVVDSCAVKKNVNGDDHIADNEDNDDDVMFPENGEHTQRPQRHEMVGNKEMTQEDDDFLNSLGFVVTDNFTGMHFINYSIYKCNRLGRSSPIFWTAGYEVWDWDYNLNVIEPKHSAVPPNNARSRRCKNVLLGLSCYESDDSNCRYIHYEPDIFCSYLMASEGNINSAAQLTMHGNGTDSTNDSAHYNDNLLCIPLVDFTVIRDVPTGFDTLFSLDEDLTAVRITHRKFLEWTPTSCVRGIDQIENCHFQKCGDVYYTIGGRCVRFHSITITFNYSKVAFSGQTHNFSGQIVDYVQDAMSSVNTSHPYRKGTNILTLDGSFIQTIRYIFDDNSSFMEPNSPLYIPFFVALLGNEKLSDLLVQAREEAIDILKIKACATFVEKSDDEYMRLKTAGNGAILDEKDNYDYYDTIMDDYLLPHPSFCDAVVPRDTKRYFGTTINLNSAPKLNFDKAFVVFGYATMSVMKRIYK